MDIRLPTPPPRRRWLRGLLWLGVVAVLMLVFWAYLQPDMAFLMAQQLWNCF